MSLWLRILSGGVALLLVCSGISQMADSYDRARGEGSELQADQMPYLLAEAAPPAEVPDGVRSHQGLRYDPRHVANVLDLYLPSPGATSPPLVVWIQGNSWRSGDRDNVPVLFLTTAGYAVASIDFRSTAVARHPAQRDDCRQAVRWLRSQAGRYGYRPDRIALVGAASGGHLAMLTALQTELSDPDAGVQAVCAIQSPHDINRLAGQSSRRRHALPRNLHFTPESLLIGKPVVENSDAARDASPIAHVEAAGHIPPVLLVHSPYEASVPIVQSTHMWRALLTRGADVRFERIEFLHFGFGWSPEVQELLVEFLDDKLTETAASNVAASGAVSSGN